MCNSFKISKHTFGWNVHTSTGLLAAIFNSIDVCLLFVADKGGICLPHLAPHPFPLNEMKLFCLLPEIYNTYPQFRFAGACVNLFIWISFCGCLSPLSPTQSYFSTVFGQLCITNFLGSKWRAKCFPLPAFLRSAFQVLKINVTFGPLLSPFPFVPLTFFRVGLKCCRSTRPFAWKIHSEVGKMNCVCYSQLLWALPRRHKKKTFSIQDFWELVGCVI